MVNVVFMLASILCFASVIMYPLVTALCPTGETLSCGSYVSVASIVCFVPSILLGVWWFIERHSDYMWILQDIFGVCLCFVFLDTIHLPSLRVAFILLIAAFAYDVFFVYLSPYVFGSNVMVAVASGGANVKVHSKDFCTLYPNSPECYHETMPLVLRLPLLFSSYGGEAMLGLGDIVLPGLLVSFVLRYDYCRGNPISRNYFMVASVAYGVGLLLANIMAVVLRHIVAGQPALMYIVPILLGSVYLFAKFKQEVEELWTGPPCMTMNPPHGTASEVNEPLLS